MKNITKKITLAILSLSLIASAANAGELTVTGSAKATYTILSSGTSTGKNDSGKGIGIANEFNLGASGELENGWAWKYNQNIDDATVQDDAGLAITMNDLGTVAINVSQGGLAVKYGFDASAYGVGSDTGYGGGTTSSGASANTMQYGKNMGSYNNVQYHLPAILPFGITAKVAVSPNAVINQNASSHATGSENAGAGDKATEYAVTAAPYAGLTVGASYFDLAGESSTKQAYNSGSAYIKYSMGPVTVGYGETRISNNLSTGTAATTEYNTGYRNKAYSVGFKVNDALSLSYTNEESQKRAKTKALGTGVTTRADKTMEIDTIQAAYTMGGMTLSVSSKDVEGDSYTTGKSISETILAIAMAF